MPPRSRCAPVLALLLGLSTVCVAAAAPLKIAFVYVGPVADGGWSYQHNLGRLALEREFGPKIETTYVESVPESADAERVIRQLAAKDYAVIFTTSYGYMEPTLKVSRRSASSTRAATRPAPTWLPTRHASTKEPTCSVCWPAA